MLAWLVSTCFFILPLGYPCTSIIEAVAGERSEYDPEASAASTGFFNGTETGISPGITISEATADAAQRAVRGARIAFPPVEHTLFPKAASPFFPS